MAHLSPSAIFSPSVARQEIAIAKDWHFVDNWLSSHFNGKSPPPFERNADTLKAFLALAALNETTDEERHVLATLEVKALQNLQADEEAVPNASLALSIENALTREGNSSLEALYTLSVVLNQPLPDIEKMAQCIFDCHATLHEAEQICDRCMSLERYLDAELLYTHNLLDDLQSEAYSPAAEFTKQTTDYQRKAKSLAAKIPELKDRVATLSLRIGTPKFTIQAVKAEEDEFKGMMSEVKVLEDKVREYHGLPQDTDLARLELEGARVQLQGLTQQRDNMFEGLVERESPRKPRS